jgi:tetratricopeptide (TPR) repeat protein
MISFGPPGGLFSLIKQSSCQQTLSPASPAFGGATPWSETAAGTAGRIGWPNRVLFCHFPIVRHPDFMTCQLARAVVVAAVLLAAAAGCRRAAISGTPEDLVRAAWNEYRLGEFARALDRFEAARAAAQPGSDLHLHALYGLGTTWNLRRPGQDPARARTFFEDILQRAPRHDLAAWSSLALARMKHLVPVGQDPDYPAVRTAYRGVMDRFPDHLAAKEAFIYLMATHVATLEEKELLYAVEELKRFIRDNRSGEFVGPASSLLAVSYTALGRQEERLAVELAALKTTEQDPTNPFTELAWAYWNIATIAEFEVGDFAAAREYYRRLIAEYPQDQRVYGARQALARMDQVEERLRAEGGPAS